MVHRTYESAKAELESTIQTFKEKAQLAGSSAQTIVSEFEHELIIRAVHESNWQEGLKLEEGKTQKFAEMALEELPESDEPGLDLNLIVSIHHERVADLFSNGASVEEVGAYNLTYAFRTLYWITNDLGNRNHAGLALPLKMFSELGYGWGENQVAPEAVERARIEVRKFLDTDEPVSVPLKNGETSLAEYRQKLIELDHDSLLHAFNVSHLHCLHRIIMMGMLEADKCGVFRKSPVHVGNPDLLFPPASALQSIMKRYCREAPWVLSTADPIKSAAKMSHRLVHIHPYEDGNGRLSRLIMNLYLMSRFPPVYLKADRKGRKRYGQALRRADRGNYDPLCTLIASSLIEIYKKMIDSLER